MRAAGVLRLAFGAAFVLGATNVGIAAETTLTYVDGSSVKINQILGEQDNQLHQPTLSRTFSRYKLAGVDLGYSFEHKGRAIFLFGDTVGAKGHALDAVATTDDGPDATNPDLGVKLNFFTDPDGTYLTVQPPGVRMGPFETPVSGISLNGHMYVVVNTNHSDPAAKERVTDRSVLTRAAEPLTSTGFTPLRTISQMPGGHFINMSLHALDPDTKGLPPGGPWIAMWGSGDYRHSDLYLGIVPSAKFEAGEGTLYFTGLDASGAPQWSASEGASKPVIVNGTIGDCSVTWSDDLKLWLATYDSHVPGKTGVLFHSSPTPWGPWSDPQMIFNVVRDHALGTFIHDPTIKPDDGLAGPVIGKGTSNPQAVHGGIYAPYMVERWTNVANGELTIHYVMSTWNPYIVVLMKSNFHVGTGP